MEASAHRLEANALNDVGVLHVPLTFGIIRMALLDRLNPPGDIMNFVAAARSAAAEGNWYAAIAVVLTLPDICASVENPLGGRSRYEAWWDRYVAPRFEINPDEDENWTAHSVLPGSDAYLLRCAYLHSGTDDLVKARKLKDRIRFLGPPTAGRFGQSRDERVLSVGLEWLVEFVCRGVEKWLGEIEHDEVAKERLFGLVGIIPSAITVVDYAKHEDHQRCSSLKAAGRLEVLSDLELLVQRLSDEMSSASEGNAHDMRALAIWGELSGWLHERKRIAAREVIDARAIVGRLP